MTLPAVKRLLLCRSKGVVMHYSHTGLTRAYGIDIHKKHNSVDIRLKFDSLINYYRTTPATRSYSVRIGYVMSIIMITAATIYFTYMGTTAPLAAEPSPHHFADVLETLPAHRARRRSCHGCAVLGTPGVGGRSSVPLGPVSGCAGRAKIVPLRLLSSAHPPTPLRCRVRGGLGGGHRGLPGDWQAVCYAIARGWYTWLVMLHELHCKILFGI